MVVHGELTSGASLCRGYMFSPWAHEFPLGTCAKKYSCYFTCIIAAINS